MEPVVVGLAARLTELAIRNSAVIVGDRIRTARARSSKDQTIAELEEIIGGLIDDKQEAIQIGKALEEELVAQQISEADIAYVTDHLLPVLEKLQRLSVDDAPEKTESEDPGEVDEDLMGTLRPILSKETMTILQLLGFNFKQAIGEPLTVLLRNFILGHAVDADSDRLRELQIEQNMELAKVCRDQKAYNRWQTLTGSHASS